MSGMPGMLMKDEIELTLQPLVGEPLCGMFRFVGIQAFEFGVFRPCKNRKGEDVFQADQRLHVSCSWCITGPEGFILSREDFGPDKRHDEKAYPFYESLRTHPPVVEAIEVDEEGALCLRLSHGYTLDIRPDEQEEEPDEEQWRYLPEEKERRHLVLTLQGLES